jgi:hypothetical protein
LESLNIVRETFSVPPNMRLNQSHMEYTLRKVKKSTQKFLRIYFNSFTFIGLQ